MDGRSHNMGSYSSIMQPHELQADSKTGLRACENCRILQQQRLPVSIDIMGASGVFFIFCFREKPLLGLNPSLHSKLILTEETGLQRQGVPLPSLCSHPEFLCSARFLPLPCYTSVLSFRHSSQNVVVSLLFQCILGGKGMSNRHL